MSTAEDVFGLYDQDRRLANNDAVIPFAIGDPYVSCEFRVKCYIKAGEECPICYEPIMTKYTAYLTNCGHAFHKQCLFAYMEARWSTAPYLSSLQCPLCRCALGHPVLLQRYKSSYFNGIGCEDHTLDKLEDFWLSHQYTLPVHCSNDYDHYIGLNRHCATCIAFRENGYYSYDVTQNNEPFERP